MKDLEKQLKALANRRRLGILKHLRGNREAAVGELARAIHLSFRSTSKHLGVLMAAGILEKEQRGPQVFYRLTDTHTSVVKHTLSLL